MILAKYDHDVLRCAVRKALDCTDSVWYRYTLKRDVSCTLSDDEERVVTDGAVKTAADMARRIMAQNGLLSPQELAEVLRLKIIYSTEELLEPYLYIGLYDPDNRTITLNNSAIALVGQFVRTNGLDDLTPSDDITPIALFHEIFHALEEENPDIYTRSRMLARKVFGIFPYMRGLDSVSEIGAVHFSKCMAGITYSPCIYERYLLLALNQLSIDFLPPNM